MCVCSLHLSKISSFRTFKLKSKMLAFATFSGSPQFKLF